MSLKKDTVWATLDTFVNQGAAFVFRLVLAHQLAPADFGVLAMANTTLAVLQMINDFGISSTVIQRKKEDLTPDFLATAFTAAIMVSGTLFVLNQALIARISASYFHTPEVENLVRVLGLVFLFMPFSSMAQALLMRERQFLAIARSRAIGQIGGIVAGVCHLLVFRSIWALPVQILSSQLISTVLFYRAGQWKPRLHWSAKLRGELFGFSGVVFVNNLLVSLSKNADQLILGSFVGPAQLGLYSLSFFLTDTVRSSMMSIMNRVLFVHYASSQHDNAALQKDYLRTLRWNCDLLFPAMILLAALGPKLLPLLLGEHWQGLGLPLQLLSLSVCIHAAGGTTSTLFVALGRPRLELGLFSATFFGVFLPLVLAGSYYYGLVGAALGVTLAKLVSVVVRQYVLQRLILLRSSDYFKVLGRSFLECAPLILAVLGVYLLSSSDNNVVIISLGAIAALSYAAVFGWRFRKQRNAY